MTCWLDLSHQTPYLFRLSSFRKSKFSDVWSLFFSILLWCLTTRVIGLDYDNQNFYEVLFNVYRDILLDYASILWNEFVDNVHRRGNEITSHRQWSCILFQVYLSSKIVYNPTKESIPFSSIQLDTTIPGQSMFLYIGQIPEIMLKCGPT